MTVETLAESTGRDIVTSRVVEVDGIPMSALCTEARRPRAVVLAVHGGATTARYFDCPNHPSLSLMRTAAALGYTVLALDRPGYGASAEHAAVFDDPARRVAACYGLADALLDSRPRGAGVFLAAHSAGCDLGLRMAADRRGSELLGLELAGTGLRKQPEALARIEQVMRTGKGALVSEMLWYPAHLHPPELVGGRTIGSPAPRYESAVVREWPDDLRALAPAVRIPVRMSHAEYEKFWRTDPSARDEIEALFDGAPRFLHHTQLDSGHNLSVGHAAAAYHLGLLSFVEQCALGAAQKAGQ
ncbi:alpha/beta hydrolase [Nocardia nova]|uniref:alpha/beta hydrolase n=1 Tax=Nocardia nova TaxID=37330 RepID=UPI0033C73056